MNKRQRFGIVFISSFFKELKFDQEETLNIIYPILHGYPKRKIKRFIKKGQKKELSNQELYLLRSSSFALKLYIIYILHTNREINISMFSDYALLKKKYSDRLSKIIKFDKLVRYYVSKLDYPVSSHIYQIKELFEAYKNLGVLPDSNSSFYYNALRRKRFFRSKKEKKRLNRSHIIILRSRFNKMNKNYIEKLSFTYADILKAELLIHLLSQRFGLKGYLLEHFVQKHIRGIRTADIDVIRRNKRDLFEICKLIISSGYKKTEFLKFLIVLKSDGSEDFDNIKNRYVDQTGQYLEIEDKLIQRLKKEYKPREFKERFSSRDFADSTFSNNKLGVLKAELIIRFYKDRYKVQYSSLYRYVSKYVKLINRNTVSSINSSNKSLKNICDQILKSGYNSILFIEILFDIAAADRVFSDKEDDYIYSVANYLKVTKADVRKIRDQYLKRGVKEKKTFKKTNSRSSYFSSSITSYYGSRAYKILGVDKNASAYEIKKAYRTLAMKFHPDKFATQGQKAIEKAEDQFQIITDAYELIKSLRGIC